MDEHCSGVNDEGYLKVLLEEFRANREIYPQLESQVAAFLTVIVTLFAGALVFFPQAITTQNVFILLILSLIFGSFGLGIGFRLRQFFTSHLYERLVLRPKIEKLLQTRLGDNSVSVLEWQEFSERILVPSSWVVMLIFGIQGAAVSLLPIGISIGLILAFFIAKSSSNTNWTLLELVLFIGSVVLLALQILGYIITLLYYQRELLTHPQKEAPKSPTAASKGKA